MTTTDQENARGVVYVAFGAPYLLQALHSIATLRRHNPDLPVLVVCNTPAPDPLPQGLAPCRFRQVEAPNARNREFKSSAHRLSPFARTLFLDCDTEIKGDLAQGFAFLDHADIAIRPEPAPYSLSNSDKDKPEAERLTRIHGEFNTGVIFFGRSDAALCLLDLWHAHVCSNNTRDQKHFVRALAACPEVTIRPLAAAWNYMRYDIRTHARESWLRHDPFVWHYMDYSYSPAALRGVWDMARVTGQTQVLRNWPYVKKQVLRPFLTRYAGLKTIDKARMGLKRGLGRITGRDSRRPR